MEVRRHDDLASFVELTAPLLQADPVRHTVAVTVIAARMSGVVRSGLATMITVHDGGALRGAALQAPGWPLITSALPAEAAAAAVDVLAGAGHTVPGATGPRDNVEAFAGAWCRRTGDGARVAMAQRLFVLGELRQPDGVPGAPRLAGLDDVALLARWRHDFEIATLPSTWPHLVDPETVIARHLAAGQGNVLWEVDGEPVSLAAASVPAAGMSRIGPVWTPPRHRGRGYGSAATAAVSRWALDAGADTVVLFTDLANPTSNSIYPKVGYRPVDDYVDLAFVRT